MAEEDSFFERERDRLAKEITSVSVIRGFAFRRWHGANALGLHLPAAFNSSENSAHPAVPSPMTTLSTQLTTSIHTGL